MTTLFDSTRSRQISRQFGRGVLSSLPSYPETHSAADEAWYIQDCARREAEAEAERRARRIAHEPDPSFILRIKDRSYSVQPLHTPEVRLYSLTKSDGTTYHVHEDEHGIACDCPDYVWKREGLDPQGCKHVRALVSPGCFA
jgi:hypothetical protein